MELSSDFDASVLNLRFIKPLDEAQILKWAHTHSHIVVVEENMAAGGVGEAIAALLFQHQVFKPFKSFSIQDVFIEHGSRDDNLRDAGLDTAHLKESIGRFFKSSTPTTTA
jgi:1-deoxy-D-xylulose-5-phosphate synthase